MSLSSLFKLPTRSTAAKVFNGCLFNISWLAIVLSQSSVVAFTIVGCHLVLHFFLMGRGVRELRFIALVWCGGFVIDQALFDFGIFTIAGDKAAAPLWLSCLWPVLATTLMHAFSGLQGRLALASILGFAGGYLSYSAGTNLSDIAFHSAVYGPLVLATLWAILFPILVMVARDDTSRSVP